MTCVCKFFGTHNCSVPIDNHECVCLDKASYHHCKASSHQQIDKCVCLELYPEVCKKKSVVTQHYCSCSSAGGCLSDDHGCICYLFFSDDINDCYFTQCKSCLSSHHDCTCSFLKDGCQSLNHKCICGNNNGAKCLTEDHSCICGNRSGICKAAIHICKCLEVGPYRCISEKVQQHQCICNLSDTLTAICKSNHEL